MASQIGKNQANLGIWEYKKYFRSSPSTKKGRKIKKYILELDTDLKI